jgi:HAD superfamily hydrolase (TIGR01549 family)
MYCDGVFRMIKNILWDFDGVILDSMKIKGVGFKELFQEYGSENTKIIEQYHYNNGGVSRFEKIKYFFNEILKKDITENEIQILAEKFAEIIEKKLYDKSNLINDSMAFIQSNYQLYNFHIVSGAEHDELNNLCKYFDIDNYFISIDGSPTKKDILVKNVLEKYNYKNEETILIGDAINDYNAAQKNEIVFYGYNNEELEKFGNYIKNLQEEIF